MSTSSSPESRALFFVFALVIASAVIQALSSAMARLEATERRANYAVGESQDLKQKLDELETEIEELRNTVEANR